jgi:hypothetical protein
LVAEIMAITGSLLERDKARELPAAMPNHDLTVGRWGNHDSRLN